MRRLSRHMSKTGTNGVLNNSLAQMADVFKAQTATFCGWLLNNFLAQTAQSVLLNQPRVLNNSFSSETRLLKTPNTTLLFNGCFCYEFAVICNVVCLLYQGVFGSHV
ncbi:unnamed protein product [Polarella glacialis]|uniref:Uncharacterized protein n=1 Tax=Polarella glacialis TaxID=89957 RepID=A0A813JGQ5_POLGL|nr:unnamed protein product [Polarella glacialis]